MNEHDRYWLDPCGKITISDETFDEYISRQLKEMQGREPRQFEPYWSLNCHGGFIAVHWESVCEYFEPCNENIGFYRASDDNRIVGVKLYHVVGNVPSLVEHQAWRFRHDKAWKQAVTEHQQRHKDKEKAEP